MRVAESGRATNCSHGGRPKVEVVYSARWSWAEGALAMVLVPLFGRAGQYKAIDLDSHICTAAWLCRCSGHQGRTSVGRGMSAGTCRRDWLDAHRPPPPTAHCPRALATDALVGLRAERLPCADRLLPDPKSPSPPLPAPPVRISQFIQPLLLLSASLALPVRERPPWKTTLGGTSPCFQIELLSPTRLQA